MTNGLAFFTMPVKIMSGLGEAVIMEIYQKITLFHGLIRGQKHFEILEEITLDLTGKLQVLHQIQDIFKLKLYVIFPW